MLQTGILSKALLYPLPNDLAQKLKNFKTVDFYEETVKSGGIGEHLSAMLFENGFKGEYNIHAVNNEFVPMAKAEVILEKIGLDHNSMLRS